MDLISQWLWGYPAGWERLLSMIGIEVHWFILQYVLGLPLLAVISEIIYLRTGNEWWRNFAKVLAKGFVIVFAVGAATGTAAEFGLVLLWPNLLEAAGKFIYFPLYLEIFAFMIEVLFVYLYFYAWDKVSPRLHLLFGIMIVVGAWYSGAMILSVNQFMQAPVNVLANYNPMTGAWSPPEVILYVPSSIAQALDVGKLAAAGAEVLKTGPDYVAVSLPSSLVRKLVHEAYTGATVGESVLAGVIKPEALPTLANVHLKEVVDAIVAKTVSETGTFVITFLSKGYHAVLFHAVGAGVTVSTFTVMGAYALRLIRSREGDPAREGYKRALKFAAVVSVIIVALQGGLFGHEMGVAVAHYNPEKFAAMEATTEEITSLLDPLGLEKFVHEEVMPALSYGSPDAKLPNYDAIDPEFRSPLIIHYLYYVKIGLAVLMGLVALLIAFLAFRNAYPIWALYIGALTPVAAQLVSFLGWATREIGRKPWAIYGIMGVETEVTMNPPSALELMGVAAYLVAVLMALIAAVYLVLWRR